MAGSLGQAGDVELHADADIDLDLLAVFLDHQATIVSPPSIIDGVEDFLEDLLLYFFIHHAASVSGNRQFFRIHRMMFFILEWPLSFIMMRTFSPTAR